MIGACDNWIIMGCQYGIFSRTNNSIQELLKKNQIVSKIQQKHHHNFGRSKQHPTRSEVYCRFVKQLFLNIFYLSRSILKTSI